MEIDEDRAVTILRNYLRLYRYGMVEVSEYAKLFLTGFKFFDKYKSTFKQWWNTIAELNFSDGAEVMFLIAQAEYLAAPDAEETSETQAESFVSHLHDIYIFNEIKLKTKAPEDKLLIFIFRKQ